MPVNDIAANALPLTGRDGENRVNAEPRFRPQQPSTTPAPESFTPAPTAPEPQPAVVVEISQAARAQLENAPPPGGPENLTPENQFIEENQPGGGEPAPTPVEVEPAGRAIEQFSPLEPDANEVLGTNIDIVT